MSAAGASPLPPLHAPAPAPRGRFLTTKLGAPWLRHSLVARPHLIDLISAAPPVTLVCAPAGYGKSTLVAHWLIQSGLPSAWVSLDTYDNDPLDFFALVAAIQTIDRSSAAGAQALLDGRDLPSVQALVHSLLMDIALTTRPFALVLDDYHVIEDQAIHAAVETLLANVPPALRVFLLTRTEPPLPLARLRGRGEVRDLGPQDLRFTDAEALDLLQGTNGLEVTPGDVGTLNERAEGWVAGLQLVGHLLRGQSPERVRRFAAEFSGNVRPIETYLWEEVIDRQPAPVQSFLRQTSILDRFTPALCDAVTGGADGAATIRQLEQERLFVIALDDVGHWHRYHHLFADVLRDRLARVATTDEIRRLHVRAAAWLEEHGFADEAIRHATAGQDWDRAVGLLEREGAALFESDRLTLLRFWLEGLPSEVFARSPRLAFWLAWALARSGEIPRAMPLLRIAEEAWTVAGDRPNLGLVRLFDAFQRLESGDTRRAIAEAQDALDRLPDDRPGERSLALVILGLAYSSLGAPNESEHALADARRTSAGAARPWIQLVEMVHAGNVLVQQGKLVDAAVLFRRVIETGDQLRVFVVQFALHRLGHLSIEMDMLDEAERTLRRANGLVESTRAIKHGHAVCLGLARLAWARGEIEDAFDEVERALGYANQTGLVQLLRDTRAQQARFWLASGHVALARHWADGCGLDPDLPPEYARQVEHLTFVRLLIADDRAALALKLLDAVGTHAASQGRGGDLVEIAVLQALAHAVDGDHAAARKAVDRALALGEPGGYVWTFAYEGRAIAPFLHHAAARGNRRDYARRLIAIIEGAATLSQSLTGTVKALTGREVEVLQLVGAGLSNRDIGRRLFIREMAVKAHLTNILPKVGAANRNQAVDRARKMGLV